MVLINIGNQMRFAKILKTFDKMQVKLFRYLTSFQFDYLLITKPFVFTRLLWGRRAVVLMGKCCLVNLVDPCTKQWNLGHPILPPSTFACW